MSLRTIRILLWLPLVAFLIVLGLVSSGLLTPHDRNITSRMVGQPLPEFVLPSGQPGAPALTNHDFANGKPRLINFFGSWCIPCAAEAPQLMALKQAGIPIVGIALRDRPADTAAFLQRNGNPYARIAQDNSGATQVSMGSSGVPETFVVDGHGIIRQQHIGPIEPEDLAVLIAAMQGTQ